MYVCTTLVLPVVSGLIDLLKLVQRPLLRTLPVILCS